MTAAGLDEERARHPVGANEQRDEIGFFWAPPSTSLQTAGGNRMIAVYVTHNVIYRRDRHFVKGIAWLTKSRPAHLKKS